MTTHGVGPAVAMVTGSSTEVFASDCKWLLLKVLYMAVLFCECSLSIAIGLLHVTKSILELINLRMQIADLSLYTFISIDFDAMMNMGQVLCTAFSMSGCSKLICLRL